MTDEPRAEQRTYRAVDQMLGMDIYDAWAVPRDRVQADTIELFRKALLAEHSSDWSMETCSEAAHICARALADAGLLTTPPAPPTREEVAAVLEDALGYFDPNYQLEPASAGVDALIARGWLDFSLTKNGEQ